MRSNQKGIKLISIGLFVCIFTATAFAADLTVPTGYPTIQEAIDAAVSGADTVLVSPGTYIENINFNGKDIVLTSTDPNNPAVTIIDGNAAGSVVTFAGTETSACELRGFTITNGIGTLTNSIFRYGGGIYGGDYPNLTQATITHCTITGNTATSETSIYGNGGGLAFCAGLITHCMITGNMANDFGGGLHWCNGPITNCTITGNTAGQQGGSGGGLEYCNGPITNCTITGNWAWNGGGLFGCNGAITYCTITGNTAWGGGGLLDCDGSITHCTITDNTAFNGGGLFGCNGSITNSIIWNNAAESSGDQLYNSSIPTYSCIQDWTGGGTGNIITNPMLANPGYWDDNGTPSSEWDDFWINGDYHLKSEYGRWDPNMLQWVTDAVTSPCIDAGDPTYIAWQNELWPHGGRINMGAYGGTPQASMSANPIGNVADLDHDDTVGILDLELFCDDWLYNEHLLDTDLNLDGKVDIADFADFANQWLWGS